VSRWRSDSRRREALASSCPNCSQPLVRASGVEKGSRPLTPARRRAGHVTMCCVATTARTAEDVISACDHGPHAVGSPRGDRVA
jgi:hypothetical protein